MIAKKVILVEDDSDDRDLFVSFFGDRKDTLLLSPCANGVELTRYLDNVSSELDVPDLIVLDQNMPKMNGKQTLS